MPALQPWVKGAKREGQDPLVTWGYQVALQQMKVWMMADTVEVKEYYRPCREGEVPDLQMLIPGRGYVPMKKWWKPALLASTASPPDQHQS